MRIVLVLFFMLNSVYAFAQEAHKRLEKLRFDSDETVLRNSSFFAGIENVAGNIPKGTEARILNYDLTKRYGVGVQVEITSGPNRGKRGWVYYPIDPKKREVTLMDRTGLPFVREGDFFEFFKKAADYKSQIKEATHVDLTEESPVAIEYDPTRKDYIWRQISKGKYKIDLEKYDGGPFVPVIAEEEDSDGNKVTKTLFVRRDYNKMLSIAGNVSNEQLAISDEYCPPMELAEKKPEIPVVEEEVAIVRPKERPEDLVVNKEEKEPSKYNWHHHCEILEKKPLLESDEEKMGKCLHSLKKAVTENNLDSNRKYIRSQVFKDMYRRLNPIEQRFLAMTVTAYGESSVLRDERDMKMIMKVIDNRKDKINTRGKNGVVNELDIVLQPFQFSMYNNGFDDWRRSLEASPHDPGVKLSIKAFRNYPSTVYDPPESADKILHYHATFVSPSWASSSKRVPILIDGERTIARKLKYKGQRIDVRHEFYQNIAYGFVKNPWSP